VLQALHRLQVAEEELQLSQSLREEEEIDRERQESKSCEEKHQ
jgi:hypothetical protein